MIEKDELVLVVDTETTNSMDDPIFYDLGMAVVRPYTGEVIKTYSYINKDIFYNPGYMMSAYYIDKMPQYLIDIAEGRRKVMTMKQIKWTINFVMDHYHIKKVFAHNARFDYKSTHTTIRYITKSAERFIFPYGTQYGDTLKMARQCYGHDENYKAWCKDNGFITKNNQVRLTAEVLYRYLTENLEFNEDHTGLEDVLIEKEILRACLEKNPEVDWKLWAD